MPAFITDVELAEHRADAEARMGAVNGASDCVVRRPTGGTVTLPSGDLAPEWSVVYAATPMRLAGVPKGSAPSRRVDVGGTEYETALRAAHFPYGTDLLADGDHIEITAGENVGLVLRIVEETWQDQATARRVPVVQVPRPAEWATAYGEGPYGEGIYGA